MLRHPAICLAPRPRSFILRKELHFFDGPPFTGSDDRLIEEYHQMFAGAEASHPGEFTPGYLRSVSAAELVGRAAGPETVLVCLLRDPVERFYSAFRWQRRSIAESDENRTERGRRGLSRHTERDALWGGMYATQLRAWRTVFARDRFVVLSYEAVVEDPASALGRVWSAMGLEPVEVGPPLPRSETSSPIDLSVDDLAQKPDFRSLLQAIYHQEVLDVEEEWGIDSNLWTATWQ